jgi:hypothetical protein
MKNLFVFCISLALAGCHGEPAPAHPEPEEPAAAPAKDGCVVPTTDALARIDGITESDISLSHDIDFNDDGQTDAVVRVQSGREPTQLLYIRQRGCIRFLDKIEAFRFGCEEGTQSNGYCHLWVETWLLHGDRQRETMIYSDGAYQPTGATELIPGPRDRPN